jgi:hypothetical protein
MSDSINDMLEDLLQTESALLQSMASQTLAAKLPPPQLSELKEAELQALPMVKAVSFDSLHEKLMYDQEDTTESLLNRR